MTNLVSANYVWLCCFHFFFFAILIEQWEFRVACCLMRSRTLSRFNQTSFRFPESVPTCPNLHIYTHTNTLTSSTVWKESANSPRDSSSELIKRLAAASQSCTSLISSDVFICELISESNSLQLLRSSRKLIICLICLNIFIASHFRAEIYFLSSPSFFLRLSLMFVW